MVQTIKKQTYRCRFCKKIYTSIKRALECEEDCLQETHYIMKPRTVKAKIDGKRMYIVLYDRVLKDEYKFSTYLKEDGK